MIIGLTGGSGSGKSSASRFFEENGFVIIDFDALSRKVSEPGRECLNEIKKAFGDEIIAPDGSLLRKALGDIVFSDEKKLATLNTITHKYILKEADNILEKSKGKNIIFDAPLLFEANLHKKCDYTICILADRDERIKRIAARDNISLQSAECRIKSQKGDSYYIEKSDYIIYNNKNVDHLKKELADILRSIADAANSH